MTARKKLEPVARSLSFICSLFRLVPGMVKLSESTTESTKERLQKLSTLQKKLLAHAFKFPNVKRIVYSTCSIHEEENELVVAESMQDEFVRNNFELVTVLPKWHRRGLDKYAVGSKCARADPDKDLCNGFFVALFQRKSQTITDL